MKKINEVLIEKKTRGAFKKEEIPSVYALVECYRRYQEDVYGRKLDFRKALEEFIELVYIPISSEIKEKGTKNFYKEFMDRAENKESDVYNFTKEALDYVNGKLFMEEK